MENAAKALIMAGGLLLSIIVASLLMLMINSLTSYQEVVNQSKRNSQTVRFNNQYDGYIGRDIRGNEMYSLVNKVIDYNKRQSEVGVGVDEEGGASNFTPITLRIDNLQEHSNMFSMDLSTPSTLFEHNILIKGEYNNTNQRNDGGTGKIKNLDDNMKLQVINEILHENLPEGPSNGTGTRPTIEYTEKILENLVNSYDTLFNYGSPTVPASVDFKTSNRELAQKRTVLETFNRIIGKDSAGNYFFDLEGKTDGDLANLWEQYLSVDSGEFSTKTDGTKTRNIWHTVNIYFEYIQFKRALFRCDENDVKYDPNTGRIIEMNFKFTEKFD